MLETPFPPASYKPGHTTSDENLVSTCLVAFCCQLCRGWLGWGTATNSAIPELLGNKGQFLLQMSDHGHGNEGVSIPTILNLSVQLAKQEDNQCEEAL